MSGLQTALYSATRTSATREEPMATDAALDALSLLEPDTGSQRQDGREPFLPRAEGSVQVVEQSPAQSTTTRPESSTSPAETASADRTRPDHPELVTPPRVDYQHGRSLALRWIIAATLLATLASIAGFVWFGPQMTANSTSRSPNIPATTGAAAPVTASSNQGLTDRAANDPASDAPKPGGPAHDDPALTVPAPPAAAHRLKRQARVAHTPTEATTTLADDKARVAQTFPLDQSEPIQPSTPNPFVAIVQTPREGQLEAPAETASGQTLTRGARSELGRDARETGGAPRVRSSRSDVHEVDAVVALGAIAAASGRRGEAFDRFDEALRIDPRHGGATAGLLGLVARDNPRQAERSLLQAIAQSPTAPLYFALGNVYAMRADWNRARTAYAQALAGSPDNADYAYNLAVAHEHLGQPRHALDHYRLAVTATHATAQPGFDPLRVQQRIDTLERHADGR